MTERHTPGPWQYLGTDVTDGPVITTTAGDVEFDEVLGTSEWCRIEDADGRLMAAAPELLEALETMLDTSQSTFDNIRPKSVGKAHAEDISRAAIAKAYGEDE